MQGIFDACHTNNSHEKQLEMSNSDELFTRDELQDKFGWEEYLMFALLLLVSVAIGVFYWWRGQVRGTNGIPIKRETLMTN